MQIFGCFLDYFWTIWVEFLFRPCLMKKILPFISYRSANIYISWIHCTLYSFIRPYLNNPCKMWGICSKRQLWPLQVSCIVRSCEPSLSWQLTIRDKQRQAETPTHFHNTHSGILTCFMDIGHCTFLVRLFSDFFFTFHSSDNRVCSARVPTACSTLPCS